MKRGLSIATVALVLGVGLFVASSGVGQTPKPQSNIQTGSLASAVPPQPQPTPAQPSPAPTIPALTMSVATNSPGSDVLNHLASMFQSFGLFITCIVAVIGLGAALFGFLAYKSVTDFLKDWEQRLIRKEADWKDTLDRAHEAEDDAKKSAEKAAKSSREIEDTQAIIDKMLKDVDEIRAKLRNSPELQEQRKAVAPEPEQKLVSEVEDTVSAKEEAVVAERLKGKIPGSSGEAKP